MGATILSDLDGLLKRHYGKGFIETQQQTDPDFMSTMPVAADKPGGEDGAYRFAVRMERRQNGGAQNQNEQFRENETGVRKQSTIAAKINIWAVELTGFSMELSKAQVDAFVAGLDDEFEDALAMMKKDENRQCFGAGTGVLTQVNGAVTNDTAIIVDSVQYFFVGERIDIYTGSTLEAANVKITAINESTLTITVDSAVTVSNNANIYRAKVNASAPSDGKEMMGLEGISDDGTLFATFQGLSRSTYDIWKGSITDASGAQLTNDLLQRAADKGERRSGKTMDTLVSHRNQRRQYLNLTTPLKRFQDDNLDAGFKALEWNGHRWLVSHDCQRDVVYMYPRKAVERYEVFSTKLDDTGGTTVYKIPRTDTFEAYYKHYANVGTRHPASVVRLDNLATLSD